MSRKRPPWDTRPTAPLTIRLPLDWSPDHALAMFEIIDALRDHLWHHYAQQIKQAARRQQTPTPPTYIADDDVPF